MIPCPLTTFIMSYALARGMLAAGLAVTAAMTLGMIATIGGIALAAAFARDRFMGLLARTESWRHHAGLALEVGSSVMVLVFGLWMMLSSLSSRSRHYFHEKALQSGQVSARMLLDIRCHLASIGEREHRIDPHFHLRPQPVANPPRAHRL
jgi:ABC-type nickel/cobalt efflux system permease component RcnA